MALAPTAGSSFQAGFVRDDTTGNLKVDVATAAASSTVDTELPTPAALADTTANPTLPAVAGYPLVYNGTTWDRVRDANGTQGGTGTGLLGSAVLAWDNVSAYQRIMTGAGQADGSPGNRALGVALGAIFNGATYDRVRSVGVGDASTVGILANGNFVYNGATWDRAREATADTAAVTGLPAAANMLWNGSTWDRQRSSANGDASTVGIASTHPAVYNGASFDRQRTPNVFKSFASTAITAGTGATIWTPAGGKKFRLMGFAISSSAAGVLIFGDNAVGTVIARSPAVAAAGIAQLGAGDLGNGILSAAANNVLKIDGPTGNVAGMVWGTEE